MPHRSRLLTVFLILIFGLGAGAFSAKAQEPQPPQPLTIQLEGTETADQIRTIVEGVADGKRPVVIHIAKPAPAAAAETKPDTENVLLVDLQRGTLEGWQGIGFVPKLMTALSNWWQGSPSVWLALLKLVVIVAAGAISGAFAYFGMGRIGASRQQMQVGESFSLATRLRYSLLRTAAAAVGLIVGLTVSWFVIRVLTNVGSSERLLDGLFFEFLLSVGIFLLIGWFLLAPGEPARRVLTIPNAEKHWAFLCGFAVMNSTFVLLAKIALAPDQTSPVIGGLLLVFGTIGTIYKVWWFWQGRNDIAQLIRNGATVPGRPSAVRNAFALTTPWILILSAVLVWMIGRISNVLPDGYNWAYAGNFTQFLIIVAPILAAGASQLAHEQLNPQSANFAPIQSAVRSLAVKLSAGAVWVLSFMVLAWTWRFFVKDDTFARSTFLSQLGAIVAIAVMGWIMTNFLRALFRALEPDKSERAEGAPEIPSWRLRMATVLPILRGLAVGLVVGLTGLLILTKLGVDISPLLAGFGIFGLAISFGSQTLVKDIVAGFFFMVEDAFRTGEYIDTGKQKGTVEKISMRSVQLRHQSGVLHTIPFGQLGAVTNASRDWATVKFNIRLDRTTDIDQARKIIKKVGIELQEDPEWSSSILMPPKMQGVDEIADTAVVIRIKFTALPPQSSALQREALKRIYLALTKAGITFATNAVMVRSSGHSEEEMGAAAAIKPLPVPQPA